MDSHHASEQPTVAPHPNPARHEYEYAADAVQPEFDSDGLLEQIESILRQNLPLDMLYRQLVTAIAERFANSFICIYAAHTDMLQLQCQHGFGHNPEQLSFQQGIVGRCARTKQAYLVAYVDQDPDFIRSHPHIQSSICVPLLAGQQLLGVLMIESIVDTFNQADAAIVINVCRHVSNALGQAALWRPNSLIDQHYRAMLDAMPDGIVVQQSGRIVYSNAIGIALLGFESCYQILGSDLAVMLDQSSNTVQKLFEQALATKQPLSHELRYDPTKSSEIPLRLTIIPITFAGNSAVQIVIRDHTAIQQREAAQQLANEREKRKSLGLLAGGIAHDFNNILMGIRGNVSLGLLDLIPTHPIYQQLQEIEALAIRATELTQQIVAYTGSSLFVSSPVDLNAQLRELTPTFSEQAHPTTSITYELDDQLGLLKGDVNQLNQIILSIFKNSIESIDHRYGAIQISSKLQTYAQAPHTATGLPKLTAGSYITLSIRDNGVGMDAHTQGLMFDPYFSTKFAGRGLGLAAVLGMVRAHHGSIAVWSQPQMGTEVTVLLPPHSILQPTLAATNDVVQSVHNLVMLIDDEPPVRMVTERMLQRLGLTVRGFGDGQSAIKAFREQANEYQLVLLDLTMPHFNGIDTAHGLRAIRNDVPIVLMSGYSVDSMLDPLLNDGLAGFLQKPFTLSDLQRTINSVSATKGRH
ncbi:response regulator [Herpetosiphon geysericola]|uniref:response regulator n=1 Tax=Herpetosiphon geysericola TaxID=70996 RepID=UPI0006C8F131|nr:response regulator [Herpetosiphon geysericola]